MQAAGAWHADQVGQEIHVLGLSEVNVTCRQQGLARGTLTKWAKGFTCAGVEGQDVVKMLNEAIARRGVRYTYTKLEDKPAAFGA